MSGSFLPSLGRRTTTVYSGRGSRHCYEIIWISSFRLPDLHDRSLSRGQKLSRRASEERGCKFFLISSPRVLASRPGSWIEPDFHLLAQRLSAAQKIEFVFSCQSRNLSTGALEACASSPSRVNGKTWQATRRRNPPFSLTCPTQRCCYSSLLVENSSAHDRRPSCRPPAFLPLPASRDWHCPFAFPCRRAWPAPDYCAGPSLPLRSTWSVNVCCAVSKAACVAPYCRNSSRHRTNRSS